MACCDFIIPGLYLGNYEAASDLSLLKSTGITHILTVASDLEQFFPTNFTYLQISALDTTTEDLYSVFAQTTEFISNAITNGKVFVHCLMGISRSSTIVIAYLMQKNNLTYAQALNLTVSRHPPTDPNRSFVQQLYKLESFLVVFT